MRTRHVIAWGLALPWIAWAITRGLALDHGHPLVAVVAFTPYAAATAPLPVVVALVLRSRVAALAALVAALVLAGLVLPRAVGGAEPAPPGSYELTVMTANLYVGRADARAVMRLAEEHRVDVLSLQEVRTGTLERLDAAGAGRRLPGRLPASGTDRDGNALLTTRAMAARGTPGDAALADGLRVTTVHPLPPIDRAQERAWRRDLRRLPPTGGRAGLRILLGDFNATLDHRRLRDVLARGYEDAAEVTGDGLKPTWPVGRRRPQLAIDHVLVDRRVAVRSVSVHEIAGTDHRAVVARLAVPRGG